jgi:tripeptide aminopeptidase
MFHAPRLAVALAAALALAGTQALAEPASINAPLSAEVEDAFSKLTAHPGVKKALDFIKADNERTLKDQIELTEIPSPPFKEAVRAGEYHKRLKAAGLADARIDSEGNVIAVRKGVGNGPVLIVSAHLDTVFPEGTDVKVKINGNRYAAPGIYDDGRGLASLLSVIRALNDQKIRTTGDIVFVGTVGEEELGDLRGVKALFRDNKAIDGFISLDGIEVGRIVSKATGSRRYRIIYSGPGGHSFNAFGLPSATHAMGRAIAKISDVQTVANPKTTFTVGTVKGGTSVNAIAADAEIGLDMRSNSAAELKKLEDQVLEIARQAADDENKRWKKEGTKDAIQVNFKLVGDRPAGAQADDALIVQAARRSVAAVGVEVRVIAASSTDSNMAMSLGVPAVTLGGGGVGEGAHAPGEWYSPVNAWLGPQNAMLTMLSLVGVEGGNAPLLPKRAK